MKDSHWVFLILAVPILVTMLLVSLIVWDLGINKTIAADKANKQCQAKGFDQMKDFQRIAFTSEPMAVKCEYASYEIGIGQKR